MTTQTSTPADVRPCRLCGSAPSIQTITSSTIQGSVVLWMCSSSVRLGGKCEADAYLSEEAWNNQAPADVREALVDIALANMAKKYVIIGRPVQSDLRLAARFGVEAALSAMPTPEPAPQQSGYVTAFYEIAKMLGIPARSASPAEVWEREMKPLLQRLVDATPPVWLETVEPINEAWKQYAGDFNAMTDKQIETATERSREAVEEHESWLEAVASWEAAGKPRATPVQGDGE